jgi:protein ImuB
LNLNGLRLHSYTEWAANLRECLLRLNLAAQIGIAQTPMLAWHAARAGRPVFVVQNSTEFLAALPVETLDPSPEVLGILAKWGVQTTGEFLHLGKEAVGERLGEEGLELLDRASASSSRPLRLVQSPETFEETIEFEHEIETAEALLFVLRRFVEQLSFRLEMVYLVAEQLTLRLTLSNHSTYEHALKIPAPTRQIDTLFGMLQTHLETLRSEHPIIGLSLIVKPCRPAGEQLELFEPALRDPNCFYETLARVSALVGHDHVGVPASELTHRPDAFRLKAINLNTDKPKTRIVLNVRGLCLRRFRPPLPAQVERQEGKLSGVTSPKVTLRISKAAGPWHKSGDWWDNKPWARREWDVQSPSGALYRLVQEDRGQWFVEGIYD